MKRFKLLASALLCGCMVFICGCTAIGTLEASVQSEPPAVTSPETPQVDGEDNREDNVTLPTENGEDNIEEKPTVPVETPPAEVGEDNTEEPSTPPTEAPPAEVGDNNIEEPETPPVEVPAEGGDNNTEELETPPAETPPAEDGEEVQTPKLKIKIESSVVGNTVTYGEDICFYAQAECSTEGYSYAYEWYHNGEKVGEDSALSLTKPSLSGGYGGVYTLKAVAKNGETELCAEEQIELTVLPRRVQAEWADGDFVYTGELQRPAAIVRGIDGEIIDCTVVGGGISAGNYSATAEINSADYVLENAAHTFVIEKATPRLTLEVADIVYGTEPSPVLSGNDGGGNTVWSYGKGVLPRLPAGRNTCTVTVEETENYSKGMATAEFTVLPLELSLTWSGYDSLTYDGTVKQVTAHVSGALFPDVVYAEVTNGNGIDAGEYVAAAALKGLSAGNYALPENHNCKYTISKSNVTILAGGNTSVFGEAIKPVTATVIGKIYHGEVSFTLRKEYGTDAGEYAVFVEYTATENYAVTAYNGTYVITKALPVIAGARGGEITLADVAVGTKPSGLIPLMPAPSVAGKWKWAADTAVAFGENKLAVTFVPEDGVNYGEVNLAVVVCGKKSNAFTVNLVGMDEVGQFEGCDTPYVLTLSEGGNFVLYTANRGVNDITQSVNISVEKVGGENTAELDLDGCYALLKEVGTYLFTFELPASAEFLAYSITATVKVAP